MRTGLGEFRRELRNFANEVDDTLYDIERTAYEGRSFWDRFTHPFSSQRTWEDQTRELKSINGKINSYNGKSALAAGILILSIATMSIFAAFIGGMIAGLIAANNYSNKDALEAEILSFASRCRIYGGTFSYSGFFVRQISFNVDRFGFTV